MGQNFRGSGIQDLNIEDFAAGLRAVYCGEEKQMGYDEAKRVVTEFFTKLEQEAFRQFLHGLLKRIEKLLISKVARRGTFFETIRNERFRNLIQRIHFDMHQLMDYDFLKVFLCWVYGVQHQDRFPVITVDLEVSGLLPSWIVNEFKADIPCGCDPKFSDVLFKQCNYF
jgi:hypothetical protein